MANKRYNDQDVRNKIQELYDMFEIEISPNGSKDRIDFSQKGPYDLEGEGNWRWTYNGMWVGDKGGKFLSVPLRKMNGTFLIGSDLFNLSPLKGSHYLVVSQNLDQFIHGHAENMNSDAMKWKCIKDELQNKFDIFGDDIHSDLKNRVDKSMQKTLEEYTVFRCPCKLSDYPSGGERFWLTPLNTFNYFKFSEVEKTKKDVKLILEGKIKNKLVL